MLAVSPKERAGRHGTMVKSAKKRKKESPTPLLQKWHRNEIFEAIQTVGLDPGSFDLNDSGTEVRIKHRLSASCFIVRRESGLCVPKTLSELMT